jgi:hypothetical protein
MATLINVLTLVCILMPAFVAMFSMKVFIYYAHNIIMSIYFHTNSWYSHVSCIWSGIWREYYKYRWKHITADRPVNKSPVTVPNFSLPCACKMMLYIKNIASFLINFCIWHKPTKTYIWDLHMHIIFMVIFLGPNHSNFLGCKTS